MITNYPKSLPKAPRHAVETFRRLRYGLFIHYGLYSTLGRGEWVMFHEQIPLADYAALADRFAVETADLDVSRWATLARNSGMGYACLTTVHHDGFCLWDTATTDFNAVKHLGRDLVAEFVAACRAANVEPCLYYSVGKWNHPGYLAGPEQDPAGFQAFVELCHAQLEELMTHYGEIFYIFYDASPPPPEWDCYKISESIRRWQPNLLISDRCQMDADIMSAEKRVKKVPNKAWELCLTLNESWGFNQGDKRWKTPRDLIHRFGVCIHECGNLLLNVGPRPDGSLEPEAEHLVRETSAWMTRHRELFDTDLPHPLTYTDRQVNAGKDNQVYCAMLAYHGPNTVVAGVGNRIEDVTILGTGESVAFRQEGSRVRLDGLPEEEPDPYLSVVKLTLDGPVQPVPNPYASYKSKFVW